MDVADAAAMETFSALTNVAFVICGEAGTNLNGDYQATAEEFLDSIYFAAGSAELCAELGFDKVSATTAVAVLNKLEKETDLYAIWHTSADSHSFADFVKAYRFPPMAQLTRKNYYATANAGKLTFIALVDPGQDTGDNKCGSTHAARPPFRSARCLKLLTGRPSERCAACVLRVLVAAQLPEAGGVRGTRGQVRV